jgi:hypothetical protein
MVHRVNQGWSIVIDQGVSVQGIDTKALTTNLRLGLGSGWQPVLMRSPLGSLWPWFRPQSRFEPSLLVRAL